MAFEILKPENTPHIQGVLFDMDGLVLDTEKLFCRFWAEAGQSLGFPMTFEHGMGMRALGRDAAQDKLHSYFGPGADYTAIRTKRIELMDAYIAEQGVDLKPGIRELLDYLHGAGITCAITSSSPMERIRRYLSFHGLDTWFDRLCSGHDVRRGKPAPDIYLHGAASLGFPPEECLALEDSPTGILAAHRAGCVTVMIPDLDQPDADTEKLLHAKADSLLDIIDLLESLK